MSVGDWVGAGVCECAGGVSVGGCGCVCLSAYVWRFSSYQPSPELIALFHSSLFPLHTPILWWLLDFYWAIKSANLETMDNSR